MDGVVLGAERERWRFNSQVASLASLSINKHLEGDHELPPSFRPR